MSKSNKTFVVLAAISAVVVLASLVGKSPEERAKEDRRVEAAFKEAFKDNPDLIAVHAQQTILQLEISEKLYRSINGDKVTGNDAVRSAVRTFQKISDSRVATVWFYFNGNKVIEGQVGFSGDVEVTYLDK